MSKPKVELYNSFNEWRILTNDLSDLIGDIATTYSTDAGDTPTQPTDLVLAVNDLNDRKVKRTGDTITGSLVLSFGTITSDKPFIDCHTTWNNAGVDFSALHVDITNTASGSGSLLADFRLANVQKFGIDVNGTVIQKLTGNYLSRDIVSGSRHVREYQDLNDASANGLPSSKNKWGFTWNAKWDGAAYIKDRSNAYDHAVMMRIDDSFKNQWWFSDGTALDSPIAWVKKIDFDFPSGTALFDLVTTFAKDVTVGTNKLTVASSTGNTAVAGTLNVSGATGLSTLSTSSSAVLNSLQVTTTTTLTGLLTTNGNIAINGGTVTSSTPFINANQTWNNAGVTFKGLTVNITNTASSETSLLLDFKLGGVEKFGVDVNGAMIQKLTGKFLARDIVAGTRHIREYQDLNDGSTNGLDTNYFEWGFTWNAKWNGSSYEKDRNNVGDHAVQMRLNNASKQQWWFSDGTTPGAIAWVKKIDFDFPNNAGWMDLSLNVLRDFAVNTNKFTVASSTGNTLVAGTFNVSGVISGNGSGLTTLNGTNISSGTVADARITSTLTGKTYNGLSLTSNAIGFSVSGGTTAVATTFAGGSAYTISGTNGTTITLPTTTGTLALNNQTMYIGTSAVAINRTSSNLAIAGISSVTLPGSSSGNIILQPAAVAGSTTITLPATSGTVITSGDSGTVTNTMLGGSIADSKLLTISTSGKVSNSATTATNVNTASAIVARDASGNFSAGTITASLSGNAASAIYASAVTLTADDATNATNYPLFANAATGNLSPRTDTGLYYNPSTGIFTSAGFSGSGASLTALNGSNISSGTVADARIAASIARLAGPTFTGTVTIPILNLSGSTAYSGIGSLVFKNSGTNTISELASSGGANKLLCVKSDATGYELRALQAGTGISIDQTTFTITASGVMGATQMVGDFSVGDPAKFTVAAASGNTVISGTLNVSGTTTLGTIGATVLSTSTSITTPKVIIGTTGSSVDEFIASLTTTSTADQVIISSLSAATYRSATYEIQAADSIGGRFQRLVILAVHNGSATDSVEYGATSLGNNVCGTFAVDYSVGNMLLIVTPTSNNSTIFRVLVRATTG